ncbi:site-specific integrase [Enterocloster clostridioformis]|nr:site-specific integrase [Enterocloster clostridioformis]
MKMEKTCGNTDGKAVSEIMRVFSLLSLIFEYLMGDERENNLKTPVPRINPFAKFRFHNAREYKIRTDVIPESVMEQIEIHLDELDESQRLIYHIFSQTGMRMKEVLFLEENCLEETQYEGLMQIRYTPYKTLKARRKKGAPDYHRVFISQKLAEDIRDEIKKRQDWRQELGVPYIFVNKRPGFRTGMLNMGNYILLMNKLIKENHICGEDGELWRFTSKQQRKTLAVTLIENGGTVEELAYWLGHLNRNTAANYYAEVRKMKLAELNTKFFREKFNLLLSGEQLAEYSEEERRLLYMDFRLDQRRVEFGFCMKKMAEGGCGQRNSLHNCVNCRNLCTGEKYLSHWLELLESQVLTVQVMEEKYRLAGITEYQSFKEYERAVFLRDCYKNIVERIKAGGER